jgi:RecJ-like exonuclease
MYIKCPECHGCGKDYEGEQCKVCWGGGYIEVPEKHTDDNFDRSVGCSVS